MSKDRFWHESADNLRIDWGTSKRICDFDGQKKMAQNFLKMVCRIVKKCDLLGLYEQDGHDNWLLYPNPSTAIAEDELELEEIERIHYTTIGCVEEQDYHYLLDADFIYTELLKDCTRGHTLPPKEAYFSELYRIGVIRPYSRSIREVVCKMELDGEKARWYCCIPCFLVNVDLLSLGRH